MAEKEKEQKPAVLTLDEQEYVIDDMSDDEKMLLNHINDMQSKINTNQFMRDQLEVGKEPFISKLRDSLNAEPVEEEEAEAEA